jgi:hypothetical protein
MGRSYIEVAANLGVVEQRYSSLSDFRRRGAMLRLVRLALDREKKRRRIFNSRLEKAEMDKVDDMQARILAQHIAPRRKASEGKRKQIAPEDGPPVFEGDSRRATPS